MSKNMIHDYFEENLIDSDTSTVCDFKVTAAETTVSEVKFSESKSDKSKIRTPKPIMIKEISDVAYFASKLETYCDPDFMVEI